MVSSYTTCLWIAGWYVLRPHLERMVTTARTLLREAVGLVFPRWCPGCATVDVSVCNTCAAALRPRPWQCSPVLWRDGGAQREAELWAFVRYQAVARELIRAWKERGRLDLTAVMGRCMRDGVYLGVVSGHFGESLGEPQLGVVPVPSSASALRHRGNDIVAGLAHSSAEALRTVSGHDVRVDRVLKRKAGGADQSGLTASARSRNVKGGFALARSPWAKDVIIIDDIVTTGSTLREVARVVSSAGCVVRGCLALANTPRMVI